MIGKKRLSDETGGTAVKRSIFAGKYLMLAVLAGLLLMPGLVWGDDDAAGGGGGKVPHYKFQYAAKVVCGCNPGQGPVGPEVFLVLPGQYATTVNIHNPGPRPAHVRKKLALTFPPRDEIPGEVSPFIPFELRPDQALKVDCEQIPAEFFPNLPPGAFPFVEGFVVIESDVSLDVFLLSTAGASEIANDVACEPGGTAPLPVKVRSMVVEEVHERKVD
jgi:hypothetical protein